MIILHRPFNFALGKLYALRDEGDRLTVVREAAKFPTHPCSSFDGAMPGC